MSHILSYNWVMVMVNIHQLKANPIHFINLAVQGEEVVLCKHNKALAEIRPLQKKRPPFVFGWAKGQVKMLPGFDDPITEKDLGILD